MTFGSGVSSAPSAIDIRRLVSGGGREAAAPVLPAGDPAEPVPSVAPASDPSVSAPPAAMSDLTRLVLASGPPTSLADFFGPDADRAQMPRPTPAGLRFELEYSPSYTRGHISHTLPPDAPPGWSTAWGQAYRAPFGCWTRQEGAWEAVYARPVDDPRSLRDDAMLILRIPDQGAAKMVLWEKMKSGGGALYELDAEAWQARPQQAPPILRVSPYARGEAPRASFYAPPEAASAPAAEASLAGPARPPCWDQFFGPAAPTVNLTPQPDGPALALTFRWEGSRQTYTTLNRGAKPGDVLTSFRMEDQIWQRWVRTENGWLSETAARPEPASFDAMRHVTLCTKLDAEGHLEDMVIRAEGRAGDVTEYLLDGSAYLQGGPVPVVREVRRHPAPAAAVDTRPLGAGKISDSGDWVIINGVRVPRHR